MIKLIKSTFFREEQTKKALCRFIMKSEQLSIGEQCAEFESVFSKWQGSKYTVLFNTGSSANLALIQALKNMGKLKDGMKIGFSGITWATNVMPIMQLGMEPIPVDIELDTLNVSPKRLKEAHKKYKLDCLFLTNLLGFSDDIFGIRAFCEKEHILLIEDNCESLGSEVKRRKLGNFGLGSTFSFFVGHHMSAIEGGAVCTNDKELNKQLRMVRSHGWDRHLKPAEQKELRKKFGIDAFEAKYTFYDLAYNLRPTEITGFLGLHQLQYVQKTIGIREKNYLEFLRILDNTDCFYPHHVSMNKISNFAMPIVCTTPEIKQRCIKLCTDREIEIRPIVGGVMSDQPFFKKYCTREYNLPNSRLIHTNGFYVANNPELTAAEKRYMISTFRSMTP